MTKPIKRSAKRYSRRQALDLTGKFSLGTLLGISAFETLSTKARAQVGDIPPSEKLLFVFTASGGGSILDSFMARRESEVPGSDGLICYPDAYVQNFGGDGGEPGSELRALDLPPTWRQYLPGVTGNGYSQATFLQRHAQDTAVMASECTSVNHLVAQGRAMTGAGVDRGRSIVEAIAAQYGDGRALPAVNMATNGYLEPGTDRNLPDYARAEAVVQPLFLPLTVDGMRGMRTAPAADVAAAPTGSNLDRARALRDRARSVRNTIDDESAFGQTFACSPQREEFLRDRAASLLLEDQDLISKLMYLSDADLGGALSALGLDSSPDGPAVRSVVQANPGGGETSVFNNSIYAQVTLAFLLAKYGFSSSIALGPSINPPANELLINPPLSFDFSHNNHVATQSVMWSRCLDAVDKLIALLKTAGTDDGGTLWDRSLIYIASDFGRDRVRPTGPVTDLQNGVSTGHHLSNGAVLISPMIAGNRVYGGVDSSNLHTYGFNPTTGAADPSVIYREHDVYSAVAQTLGYSFNGQTPLPVLMRS